MANVGRKLGANISACMLETGISPDKLAEMLGYSLKNVWDVIEGKVIIPPMELERIARMLGTTKHELLSRETEYLVPELQHMKKYENPDNLDRILDLMDEYVELKEAL